MESQKKRTLVLDSHVIAYLGDYMINLKKSLKNIINTPNAVYTAALPPNGQSSTSSSHRKS
jgi:hypothetical protein